MKKFLALLFALLIAAPALADRGIFVSNSATCADVPSPATDATYCIPITGANKNILLVWSGSAFTKPTGTVVESDLSLSNVTTGNVSITKHGFVPIAPNDPSKCLIGDATWATCPGSVGSGLTSLNSQTGATQTFANDTNVTITSSANTHTLGWSGALAAARGGTSIASYTKGDILCASGATTLINLGVGTDGQRLTADAASPCGVKWSTVVGTGANTSTSATASPPSTPAAGDVWFPNDGAVIYRYSGSAWIPWGPIFPFTAWDDTTYAWVNQGSATVDTTRGGSYIATPALSSESVKLRKISAPATPYKLVAFVLGPGNTNSTNSFGLMFRESSSGKLAGCSFAHGGSGNGFYSYKWTSPTVFSAAYVNNTPALTNFVFTGPGLWFRIQDDGANRICEVSSDSRTWTVVHSVARTDFLTANEIGYYINSASSSTATSMWVLSLSVQ